nr:hypothetical protein [uncultured Gellertiella sp.]
MTTRFPRALGATLALLLLASCAPKAPRPTADASRAALPVMERVSLGAAQCWFKSHDPAFAAYHMAPELNSYSGRPRLLLVKAHSPESRPLLVVQAEGNPARVDTFGPLMNDASAGRIMADVNRWAAGGKGC